MVPPTFIVSTGKGAHYYFRVSNGQIFGNAEGAFHGRNINIRAGEAYVVAPSSKHESGATYAVTSALPPAPLPTWIADAVRDRGRGDRMPTAPRGLDSLPEVIRGPGEGFGGERHDELMRYASSLRARSVGPAEAEALFRLAWQRCEQPPACATPMPWEDARALLQDVYARYPEGSSADQQGPMSDDALIAHELRMLRVRYAARQLFDAERRGPMPPFDIGTLSEVLARPPEPPSRIPGLVPWKAGTLIVAQRKAGKTTLTGNLCRSLQTGEEFLGRGVRKLDGNIAFFNYEMPAQTLAQWFDEMGIDHKRLLMINLRDRTNPLLSEEEKAVIAERIRAHDTESIFYDTFTRAYTGQSQNDPGEVGAWLADLDHYTRGDCGALDLFLTCHTGWVGEHARGASSLEGWADSIVTMGTRKDEDVFGPRFIRAIGRNVELPEDQLSYDQKTRRLTLAGTGSRKRVASERKSEELRAAILDLLARKPGLNGTQVEEALREDGLSFQRNACRPILRGLAEKGELTSRDGKNNAKHYELAQASPSQHTGPAEGLELGASPASPASPYSAGYQPTDQEEQSTDELAQGEKSRASWTDCSACGRPLDQTNPDCRMRFHNGGKER
jgi:hypothetical protein